MLFPLIHLAPLAAGLLAAVVWDVSSRRIPNLVSGGVAVAGIGCQLWNAGWVAVAGALAAAICTIALLYAFWARGGIGGGDVKLAGAVATWTGLTSVVNYWLAGAIAGGLVASICFVRSARAVRSEIRQNLTLALLHRSVPSVQARGAGRVSVPYGVAIAIGAVFTFWRG